MLFLLSFQNNKSSDNEFCLIKPIKKLWVGNISLLPSNKREPVFDIMKGIAIICVIIGHLSNIPYMPYRHLVYTFHMPLFFILGGYFYKPTEDICGRCKKDARRLLTPYLFTALLLIIYSFVKDITFKNSFQHFLDTILAAFWGSGGKHSSLIWGNIPSIGAIWFLLALFWCRVLFCIISIKTNGWQKIFAIITTAIGATILDRYVINLPFGILPGASALIFYLTGNIVAKVPIPYVFLIVCIICWPIGFVISKLYMVDCHYELYPIDILGACGGTFTIFILSKKISKSMIGRGLEWIGRMSLLFLCFHLILLNTGIIKWCMIPHSSYAFFIFHIVFCSFCSYICTHTKIGRWLFMIKR